MYVCVATERRPFDGGQASEKRERGVQGQPRAGLFKVGGGGRVTLGRGCDTVAGWGETMPSVRVTSRQEKGRRCWTTRRGRAARSKRVRGPETEGGSRSHRAGALRLVVQVQQWVGIGLRGRTETDAARSINVARTDDGSSEARALPGLGKGEATPLTEKAGRSERGSGWSRGSSDGRSGERA